MLKQFIALTVLASLLAGCGDPTVDASSDEAMKASIERINSKLSPEEQARFKESIQIVGFKNVDVRGILSRTATSDSVVDGVKASLDGKTADQLIAEAEVIKAERAERERQQALIEIQELQAEVSKAEVAKVELSKFKILRSRFYITEGKWEFERKPLVELEVENGTSHAISRAYFKGTIASPGRAVPWLVEDFNYQISGGLEPSEKAEWTLAPNRFGEWGKVDAPADAVFTVEVVRLDGADGESLYDVSGLSDRKTARLAELTKKYQ